MQQHPGPAAAELTEDRRERRVAHVGAAHVGEQHEAVDAQMVVAMPDLGDRLVHVGKRKRGQQSEPAGVVDDRLAAGLVDGPGEVDVAEPNTGRGDD